MNDFEHIVGGASSTATTAGQRRRHATATHLNRVFVKARIELSVDRSHYFLSDLGPTAASEGARYSGTTGVISTQPSLAVVWTGTHRGKVGVTAYWRNDEPELQLEGWDEVVEVDAPFDRGEATLFGSVAGETDVIPPLPVGRYRLRIHTRGRDIGHEDWIVQGEPVEEHLLIAWPAHQSLPPVLHKLADAFGAMLRQVPVPRNGSRKRPDEAGGPPPTAP